MVALWFEQMQRLSIVWKDSVYLCHQHPASKQKKETQRAREATVLCHQRKVKRTNRKETMCLLLFDSSSFQGNRTLCTFLVNKNSALQT